MQASAQIEAALANVQSMSMEKSTVANFMVDNPADDIIPLVVFNDLQDRYWDRCATYAVMKNDTAARNANFQHEQGQAPRQLNDARAVHKRWISKYYYLCGKVDRLAYGNVKHQELLLKYICRIHALARGFWHYENVQQSYP